MTRAKRFWPVVIVSILLLIPASQQHHAATSSVPGKPYSLKLLLERSADIFISKAIRVTEEQDIRKTEFELVEVLKPEVKHLSVLSLSQYIPFNREPIAAAERLLLFTKTDSLGLTDIVGGQSGYFRVLPDPIDIGCGNTVCEVAVNLVDNEGLWAPGQKPLAAFDADSVKAELKEMRLSPERLERVLLVADSPFIGGPVPLELLKAIILSSP